MVIPHSTDSYLFVVEDAGVSETRGIGNVYLTLPCSGQALVVMQNPLNVLLLLWRLTSEVSWSSAFSCVIPLQCIKSVQLPFLFTGFGSLCPRCEAPTRGSGPAGRCHILSQQPHKRAGILVMAPMAFILSLIFSHRGWVVRPTS